MTRFRTKNHGMNTRKHSWVCLDCGTKYSLKPVTCVCGGRMQYFASQMEARRFATLRLMEKAGMITGLQTQKEYQCKINNKQITTYRADFEYWDNEGNKIVEDTKGVETELFKLKKKLVEAIHGIKIRVIKNV